MAQKNKVPVLQRKPLARALYHSVKIGQEIPAELYQAVAEIIAFILDCGLRPAGDLIASAHKKTADVMSAVRMVGDQRCHWVTAPVPDCPS